MTHVTALENTEDHFILGESLRPLLTVAMGSSVEVFDLRGLAGSGPPPHWHPWEEIHVMLDGEVEVTVDGEPHVLRKGNVAHVPAGAVHSYRNLTEAHFLTIVTKGNAARFFAQVASEVKMSPPDIPALARVASDHGITMVE
ncbi:MAG: cupin domain-containing protein [Myxococcota bacterium]